MSPGINQRGAGGMSTATRVVACQIPLDAIQKKHEGDARACSALCDAIDVELSPASMTHRRVQSYFEAVPSSSASTERSVWGPGWLGITQ